MWRTIPGFSIYQMNEDGVIRRSKYALGDRKGRAAPRLPPGTILQPSRNGAPDNYQIVRLLPDMGKSKVHKVHVLVALTFHGPRPSPDHYALHKDDDKDNNHHENIYWGTKKQNALDRSINGHHGLAKLTAEEVTHIRKLYFRDKLFYREIAVIFKISESSIAQILTGKTYRWV